MSDIAVDAIVEPKGIEDVRDVVKNHSAVRFRWNGDRKSEVILDAFTANMLVQVYDALKSEKAKENINAGIAKSRLMFLKIVDISWGGVKK